MQNYELELRLLHSDPDYGAARGVLSGVGIGKNRQITIVKKSLTQAKNLKFNLLGFPSTSTKVHD